MFNGKLVKTGGSGGDESCNVDLGIIHGCGPRSGGIVQKDLM